MDTVSNGLTIRSRYEPFNAGGVGMYGFAGTIDAVLNALFSGSFGGTGITGPTGYTGPTGSFTPSGTNFGDYIYWNTYTSPPRWVVGDVQVSIGMNAGQTGQGANSISIGPGAGQTNQSHDSVSIGRAAGNTTQSDSSIAIGLFSGSSNQQNGCISVGVNAGKNNQSSQSIAIGSFCGVTSQGGSSVALGFNSGQNNQGGSSVSIGVGSGQNSQGSSSVSIGQSAGNSGQSNFSIAIGASAGQNSQGTNSISIGHSAGLTSQGGNSICIGNSAGSSQCATGSIIINASGNTVNSSTTGTFINPIRNSATGSQTNFLVYNTSTSEIQYQPAPLAASSFQTSTLQSIPSNTATGVQFTTTNYNNIYGLTPSNSNSTFTNNSGSVIYLHTDYTVIWSNPPAWTEVLTWITVNSSTNVFALDTRYQGTGSTQIVNFSQSNSHILQLNNGDNFTIMCEQNSSGATNVNSGVSTTPSSLSIFRIA